MVFVLLKCPAIGASWKSFSILIFNLSLLGMYIRFLKRMRLFLNLNLLMVFFRLFGISKFLFFRYGRRLAVNVSCSYAFCISVLRLGFSVSVVVAAKCCT